MQPTDLSLSPCTHAHNLRWHEGGSAGSTRAALRDVVDLTGCDRAVQQQGAAEKPLLLKKKKKKNKEEGSDGAGLPNPGFSFSYVQAPDFYLPYVYHVSIETELSTLLLHCFLCR